MHTSAGAHTYTDTHIHAYTHTHIYMLTHIHTLSGAVLKEILSYAIIIKTLVQLH